MTLKIDGAGRIILPKPLRDRLGLRAGADLELHETPEGITLKPAHRRPSLMKEGSFWVHTGELPAGYDLSSAVKEDREDRMRKIQGQ